MKICCLDQSTKCTGFSFWKGRRLTKHGEIDLSKIRNKNERMEKMYLSIKKLLLSSKPDVVVIEETQFQSNPKVLRTLAQLQGLILALSYELGFGLIIVEPSMWKSYVGVKSRKREEQKAETMNIVKSRYKVGDIGEDESDSIAIGIWAIGNLVKE
jgi:Holliday junction resolvasome RuvABC endonuclease subunit